MGGGTLSYFNFQVKLMVMIFFQILCIFYISPIFAQTEAQPQFLEAISAFENNQYDKAIGAFEQLLEKEPQNPAVLYNLGRVRYEKGEIGLALGLWRKARSLDPNFQPVRNAIRFAEEKHFPERSSPPVYAVIFNYLSALSLHLWLGFGFLFFIMWAFGSVEYGVKRRVSITHWPVWLHLSFPLFLVALGFSVYLWAKTYEQKATVISQNLQSHISPSEISPTLSELYEGQIVVVEKVLGEWAQIRSLSGAPGWVPMQTLIVFKGNE